MKILHIFGDDDYAVLDWENHSLEFREECLSKLEKHEDMYNFNENNYIQLLDFPNTTICKDFLYFLKNTIMDYDDMKHRDFIILDKIEGY